VSDSFFVLGSCYVLRVCTLNTHTSVQHANATAEEFTARVAHITVYWHNFWADTAGFNSWWQTFISVCNKRPRSTQPGHPVIGRCNKYQTNGGDTLQMESKGRYGSCVGERENCDPLVTHGPYLSTLEIKGLYTVFQKKWCQNSNHYNFGTPYQN